MERVTNLIVKLLTAVVTSSEGVDVGDDSVVDERAMRQYDYMPSASNSYGGGGGGGCCGGKNDLLPLLALAGLSLLLIYLITAALTTTAGRRRRSAGNDIDENSIDDVTLDGPAWLSMIHELWQQDAVADDPSCAYHTLCRMNRIAAESGGQGTWAAHLSSVPLSYLLHHRHEAGFLGYMDASLQGKTGANCSSLFSGCSRLQ